MYIYIYIYKHDPYHGESAGKEHGNLNGNWVSTGVCGFRPGRETYKP